MAQLEAIGVQVMSEPPAGVARMSGIGLQPMSAVVRAEYVQQTFTPITSQSSWSVGSGTPTEGNLLLAFLGSVDTQSAIFGDTTSGPTGDGWTELQAGQARSAGGDCSGYVFWKWAGGSEPANYSFEFGASTSGAAHIVELSSAESTTPVNASAYVTTASGQTQADVTGLTTTADRCLLVAFAFVDEDSSGYEPYWSDPMVAGWVARYGSSSVPNTQGGDTSYSGLATGIKWEAGSVGTVSCEIDAQNDAIIAYVVAVAPGTGGPVGGGGGGGSAGGSQLRIGLPSLSLDG